ncbi:MAG TPA: prolyl oligopeptidase family serine peptidase [Pirellulales bacterium]|nr:prolyl oligopeptidase family serine peptidase [Pirellulales bacterium]
MCTSRIRGIVTTTGLAMLCALVLSLGAESSGDDGPGDRMLADCFRAEAAELANDCLADVKTLEDWTSQRAEYRRQLAEMLGLDPRPERTDLEATITGRHETEWFTVENLHFQSRPGLYVTGNLYLPKRLDKPVPAVLYVCGHAQVKKDGVSYGNKTAYQHHGGWFARNGYVCLTIDTLQLGEIEGLHHGTYREGMWWWNSRGYTPAGVEAWNCVRALDYLQSRPEVDGERLGVTGRSGGGAYSWWIAALDERIKAAVPVAGITDLQNHVVDGCVEGHCDCMFMVNTYRWDYAQVAALVAPRPLLIANTDSDGIFPLDGVERLHAKVRRIYRLHGADDKLGLQISAGGHKDIQELQVAAFRWLNRFLKGDEESLVENTGVKYFTPEELQVFRDGPPADQINTRVHEVFVPSAAAPPVPENQNEWVALRDGWLTSLKEKSFRGWPAESQPARPTEVAAAGEGNLVARVYDFESQPGLPLRLFVCRDVPLKNGTDVHVSIGVDNPLGQKMLARLRNAFGDRADTVGLPPVVEGTESAALPDNALAVLFFPRGLGPHAWNATEQKQIQNRRRFMLLGQTLAGMQAWDVRRALQAIRSMPSEPSATTGRANTYADARLALFAGADTSVPTVYATLFEPPVSSLALFNPPVTHAAGPDLLNVLRFLDLPQVMALVAERGVAIELFATDADRWRYPADVVERLKWPKAAFSVGATEKEKTNTLR